MKRDVFKLFVFLVVVMSSTLEASSRFLALQVVDTNGNSIAGVWISPAGYGNALAATNGEGKTRLSLPLSTAVGEWVTLRIAPSADNVPSEWVFISPWDGRVRVPPFDDHPDSYAQIVVGRRYDRDLLTRGEALAAITQRILQALQGPSEGITEAERQQVLAEQAADFGLDPAEIDRAIRAWQERSDDFFDKGLVALYAEHYLAASGHFEKALALARMKREQGAREEIEAARKLGESLRALGKYRESVETYREAVALRGDDPDLLKGLCWSLAENGELTEAEAHCRRALELYWRDMGDENPFTAKAMNNLAMVLVSKASYTESEPLMRQSLSIFERSFGPDHPNVALALSNLAIVLRSTNRPDEAAALLKRSLMIDESWFGPEHPKIAIRLHNLASVYQDMHRLDEAEPLKRRALAIAEGSLNPDHPDIALYLGGLAWLFQATNRFSEAEPLLRRALAINESSFGPDDSRVGFCLRNLALLFQATNRLDEAEPLLRRGLAILTASFGEDNRWTKSTQRDLDDLLEAKLLRQAAVSGARFRG